MHLFALTVALLAAVGIIGIGFVYLRNPRVAVRSFGLPLPEEGANVDWWLRLKGIRDIVSGSVVLALMTWSSSQTLGMVLFIEAIIPLGDLSLILAARGSAGRALGIHGLTAALMVLAGVALMMGTA